MKIWQIEERVIIHEKSEFRLEIPLVLQDELEAGHTLDGDAVVVVLHVHRNDVAELVGLLLHLVEDPYAGVRGLTHEEEDADVAVDLSVTDPSLSEVFESKT